MVEDPTLHSDHLPVLVHVDKPCPQQTTSIPRFKIRKANWKEFNCQLENMDIKQIVQQAQSLDDKVKAIQDGIIIAAKNSIPMSDGCETIRNYSKWWNEECSQFKKELKCQQNIYKRISTVENYVAVKKAYTKFKKCVIEAKRRSWREFVESLDFRKPVSKVYQFIKNMKAKGDKTGNPPPLTFENKILISDLEKANGGAKHLLKTIGREDPFHDEVARSTAKVRRLSKVGNDEPYNQPFTMKELENIVTSLPDTSPGTDMIHSRFVKAMPNKWMDALLEVMNLAWDSGVFPTIWKKGQAVMIPKPGKDMSKIENSRFITLLAVLGKVFERMIKKRINWEIEKRGFLKDIQCGFRRKKSTVENLLCFKQDALYALQNGWIMVIVHLDVNGAFDSMVHRQILSGVMEAGIRGRTLAVTENYLTGREDTVRVGSVESSIILRRRRGVPQGSALGPDYYNIAEYDIPIENGESKGMIFADDNSFWAVARTLEETMEVVKSTLQQIEHWAKGIDLKFSPHKSKMMVITRKKITNLPILYLNGNHIEYVKQTKVLGCVFTDKLSWYPHVEMVHAACMKRLNIMKLLTSYSWGMKADMLLEFYVKYIRPKIEYAAAIYGSGPHSTLKSLDVIQNFAVRIAFGARKTTPVIILLSESGLPELETRRKIRVSKYLQRL